MKDIRTIQKVLIVKMGYSETLDPQVDNTSSPSLGDVLRTTVILHNFKDYHVTWLCDEQSGELLKDNPFIDRLLYFNLSTVLQLQYEKFDIIVNLEKVPGICALTSSITAWNRYGFRFDALAGEAQSYEGSHDAFRIYTNLDTKRLAKRYWQDVLYEMLCKTWNNEEYVLGYKPTSPIKYDVGLNWQVGKKWPNKVWPKQNWDNLYKVLITKGYSVSWQEGKNNLREYFEWINSCRMLITHDSLGLHIAIAMKKKMLVLYGPTASAETYLYGLGRNLVPEGEFNCLPCLKSECSESIYCMDTLSIDRVISEFEETYVKKSFLSSDPTADVISLSSASHDAHIVISENSIPGLSNSLSDPSKAESIIDPIEPTISSTNFFTETVNMKPRNRQQIVLISDQPRSREAKLAYGLHRAGMKVVLLYNQHPTFDTTTCCSEVHCYQTLDEVVQLARQYSPLVFHVFSLWNYIVASSIIVNKVGKVVFDDYDIMIGMVKMDLCRNLYPLQLELERFCLENADGLCCRSIELQVAKREFGYKIRGKIIFFPDYCFGKLIAPIEKDFSMGFNIANVGNLSIDESYDINDYRNYHLKLAIELLKFKINSCLYLSKSRMTVPFSSFLQKAMDENPGLVAKNMDSEELLHEMMRLCHAGLICAPTNATKNENDLYLQTKRDFAIGNKAFDYIDAGIPIIIGIESKFLFWLIKRYQKVYDFDSFMANPESYVTQIKNFLIHNVAELDRSRHVLSITNHIPRLISFYEHL